MEESQFINSLKDSCSEILEDWEEHLDFWEGDEPGSYNEISVIVHYVIKQFEMQRYVDFPEVFGIVESACNSKVKSTVELAKIGFLEDILLVGSHKAIYPENFEQWLGEKSLETLIELEKFFSVKT